MFIGVGDDATRARLERDPFRLNRITLYYLFVFRILRGVR